MVEHIIQKVRPDYIQCDCKGHPGFSSYPTKVGNPVPGFVGDPLRVWRDVTAHHGVALFMHYSGVIDREAVRQHPDWAAVNADGKPDEQNASLFGPYVDELLIPQLRELADVYDVDGVWVDGECWAVKPEYGEAAVAAYRERYGAKDIPRARSDTGYREYEDFTRQAFREYLAHYVKEVHGTNPGFQIASNWAYSSQMPEQVNIDVDYISGDFNLQDSVNSARFEARCMQRQPKPWDLMAWSFSSAFKGPDRSTKSVLQLQQEAAMALAAGGGFQAYFKQKRDGSIFPWTMDVMAEVATFCREREQFCHHGEPVPEIALLYSQEAFYRAAGQCFGGWSVKALQPLKGALHMLLEAGRVVEICMKHHLSGRMDEYGLIVIPEWEHLGLEMRDELAAYAEAGGNLLVVGAGASLQFESELDVRFEPETSGQTTRWVQYEGRLTAFTSEVRDFESGTRAAEFGRVLEGNDPSGDTGRPAAVISTHGKGKVAAIPFGAAGQYAKGAVPGMRMFFDSLVAELMPDPIVRKESSTRIDVSLSRKDGEAHIHLVNSGGDHASPNIYVYDDIPPTGPISLEIDTARLLGKPVVNVTLEPGGREPTWSADGDVLRVDLPGVAVYDILRLKG